MNKILRWSKSTGLLEQMALCQLTLIMHTLKLEVIYEMAYLKNSKTFSKSV